MRFNRCTLALAAASLLALAGCSSGSHVSLGTAPTQTGTISMVMTDTPPSGVTVLSFTVEVTAATLNTSTSKVTLPAPSSPIEVTRLQTETGFLTSDVIPAGNYTSLTLTFAAPSLTFENNTGATITVAGTMCANGSVCTVAPTSTNLTTTISLPSTLAVTNGSSGALDVDLSLANLFSSTLSADFTAGSSVSIISPALGQTLPSFEDVVAQVISVDTTHSTVTLQNLYGTFVATVNSSTAFHDFPGSCTSTLASCLSTGQILAANMNLQSTAALIASDLYFKDANSSEPEVEGVITSVNVPAQQFNMVVLDESAPGGVSGLSIGSTATVSATSTTFKADDVGMDTTGYLFTGSSDLMAGQEVSVLRNAISSGTSLTADRVLLRASRISATVSRTACPDFTLTNLPSIFGAAGTSQITVFTSTSASNGITEFAGTAKVCTTIEANGTAIVPVRGQLFSISGGGLPTLVASKVIAP
ncbi:MAG: DUF4382 domain-containing protein [Candidatus Acidiferrales bacterium]